MFGKIDVYPFSALANIKIFIFTCEYLNLFIVLKDKIFFII